MTIETILIAAGSALLAAILVILGGQRLSFGGMAGKFSDFAIALETAKGLVRSVEQLWLTGKLDKEMRTNEALRWLKQFHPSISEVTLRLAIEAAVRLMNESIDKPIQQDTNANKAPGAEMNSSRLATGTVHS